MESYADFGVDKLFIRIEQVIHISTGITCFLKYPQFIDKNSKDFSQGYTPNSVTKLKSFNPID